MSGILHNLVAEKLHEEH